MEERSTSFGIDLGPRVRKSPYFDSTVAAGATTFSVYNHMYMPTSYGEPDAEYWRLIEGVAMWDVAAQRQVELAGPDSGRLAQTLGTRTLTGTEVGQAKYVPMCDHEGRLLNDPLMLRVASDRWWVSIADSDMLAWCRAIAFERGMEVEVTEPDVSPLAIQGPRSEEVVARLLGDWARAIPFFSYRPTQVAEIPLWVGRAGWSRQEGFELYLCHHVRGNELWGLVAEAGAPYGIGPGAPNYVERVEGALLSYRADTGDEADPFELNLGRWVDLDDSADFIGKEALMDKRLAGPRRRLVGLFLDGPALRRNTHPWPARIGDDEVGLVRAVAYSPRLRRNIAMALLATGYTEAGIEVMVESEDGEVRIGRVTELPFIQGSPASSRRR